jgi:hypothetical protein
MFFTTSVIIATSVLSSEAVFDGLSTQYLLSKGHTELNPLVKWLVDQGAFGQTIAGLWGVSTALLVGYFLGHWIIWAAVVGEGLNCYRQYKLVKEE